jgi:hypothetical protein
MGTSSEWAAGQGRAPELPPEEKGDLWPVVWEGQPVGSLKDPRYRLESCIGLWVPAISASQPFAAALGRLPQTPPVVSVGGVRALLEHPPSPSSELSVFFLANVDFV